MTQNRRAIELAYKKGYRVTEEGELIGLKGDPLKVKAYGKQRYPTFTVNGVSFTKSGIKSIRVHQFAAYCFYGEAMFEDGIIVRHLNDNPYDFSKENIALGTDKDNKADIPMRKRSYMTARRLSFEQAEEIRGLFDKGVNSVDISERYGITRNYVYDIVNYRSWRIEEELNG